MLLFENKYVYPMEFPQQEIPRLLVIIYPTLAHLPQPSAPHAPRSKSESLSSSFLRQVAVCILVPLLPLQIFLFYQNVDAFLKQGSILLNQSTTTLPSATHLNHTDIWFKSVGQQIYDLDHELLVGQLLAHLHDPHDRRLDQNLPVLVDVLMRTLLLHLDLVPQRDVDVDLQFFAGNKAD